MRSSTCAGASGTVRCSAPWISSGDLIGETLKWLEGMVDTAPTAEAKVTALLRGLETYVSGQPDLIIDYAAARRSDEPISTATTESTVQWLLHRRIGANQQMRWTPRAPIAC